MGQSLSGDLCGARWVVVIYINAFATWLVSWRDVRARRVYHFTKWCFQLASPPYRAARPQDFKLKRLTTWASEAMTISCGLWVEVLPEAFGVCAHVLGRYAGMTFERRLSCYGALSAPPLGISLCHLRVLSQSMIFGLSLNCLDNFFD